MGRPLGFFADEEELDRADLNKCPDCDCFFAQDTCPICGKVCPEEMRAGNRKPTKKPRRKKSYVREGVRFISWYHQWWVIILAMIIFPLVGFILLVTSPHKKSAKIIAAVLVILYGIFSTFGFDFIIGRIQNAFETPVETSLSEEEYIDRCMNIYPEKYFRDPAAYAEDFLSLKLEVGKKITDNAGEYTGRKYTTYYVCHDAENPSFVILVRDCRKSDSKNLAEGDVITVWGEGAGSVVVYDAYLGEFDGACINAAYIELME